MAFIVKGGMVNLTKKEMKQHMENLNKKSDPLQGLSDAKKQMRKEVQSAKRHREFMGRVADNEARDLANIISGGFTADDIPNIDASKITSGSIADARIPASAVSQHAVSFDDNAIVNDLSTIALRQATNENAIAYNTNSSFVDVFQDSSGIASHTTSERNSSEYVSTSTTGTGQFTSDSNTLILLHMDGSDY